jgi:signal transduction histidine kinase/amino acid transporter
VTSAAFDEPQPEGEAPPHPRTLGWIGTTALAMGGSNQSLFILAALFAGQDKILGQGSAAVPLLMVGLLLSWAAAPGWTELVLMFPNRVGGISATCAEAFRPYSPVLANLTGVCYWWGWVPTCGLTAILSASAIHEWYLPALPVTGLAIGFVVFFMLFNLLGIKWVTRLAIPIASGSALLAFVSGLAPIAAGQVDWRLATTFQLTTPFPGWFGQLTSLMAGLYLIGFAAPAFEAAACHVGETIDPNKAVPRAMLASGLLAGVYFAVLPLVWLGTLGSEPLGKDLALVLGPTFAPLFGNAGKAAAIWFMVLSMFCGTMQPLAGAARALSQLSEDGLLPRILARRSRTDAPWIATLLTASMAILFLLIGDPIWLIAAANFTYLISIALPSVAVWLLRRDAPQMHRPYRAPRGTVSMGLGAAVIWGFSGMLGFEQFGLTTVLIGLAFAYSGSMLYSWRVYADRRRIGLPGMASSLQIKLTGAMLLVLALDGTGYLLAVNNLPPQQSALMTVLSDIFVAVAMLSITVALILPGMITHSLREVSSAAKHLAKGTVAEFSRAMNALGRGDLDAAYARVDIRPVRITTRDEVGEMAASFNILQAEIGSAAVGLAGAREELREHRDNLQNLVEQRTSELMVAKTAAEAANSSKSEFLDNMSHELRTPMHAILSFAKLGLGRIQNAQDNSDKFHQYFTRIDQSATRLLRLLNDLLDLSKLEAGHMNCEFQHEDLRHTIVTIIAELSELARSKGIAIHAQFDCNDTNGWFDATRIEQVLGNLLSNALKFTPTGKQITVTVREALLPADLQTQGPAAIAILEVSVRDQGIGIPEGELELIFDKFVQSSKTNSGAGGTGLGLPIAREIIRQHGGFIEASHNPGGGATFTFAVRKVPLTREPGIVSNEVTLTA